MPDQTPTPHQLPHRLPAAGPGGAAEYRSAVDDDVALGCECADPALQIERWGQEALQFPLGSA